MQVELDRLRDREAAPNASTLLGGLVYLTKQFSSPKGFVSCHQHDKQPNHCHNTAELECGSLPSGSTCAWDEIV